MSTSETRSPKLPPAWFVHTAWRVHRALYRLSGGRFLWTTSNKRGWGALRLTTTGCRSGQPRSVIIGYIEDGPNLVTLAMNGWDEGHPSWWWSTSRRIQARWRAWPATTAAQYTHARLLASSVIGCGDAGSRSIPNLIPTPVDARQRLP